MDKIKVVYVITALNVGGAEMMLYRMLGTLDRKSFDVTVISLMDKGPVGKMIEDDLQIPVQSIGMKRGRDALRAVFSLGRMIKACKPQVVHTHMVHANLLTRVVRLFYRFPILICTIHNIEEKGSRKSARWRVLTYRLTDFLCDYTSQVSRAGLEKYIANKAVSKEKIAFVPNGIDLSHFVVETAKTEKLRKELGLEGKYVFLAVGSLTAQKDYFNMLEAFFELNKKHPDTVLIVVGGGPLEEDLLRRTQDLNLDHVVFFLGFRNDIPVLMNMADAYIMSSAWEGLPIVLLEAAACRLPIIATDVGGNREIVINQKNGFLVPSKNPQTLARAMIELKKMPKDAQRKMGNMGYNHVNVNYAIEKITHKWEDIYATMVKNKFFK